MMSFHKSLRPLYFGLAGLALAASVACSAGATPTPTLPTSTPTLTLEAIATATLTRRIEEPTPTPTQQYNTPTPTPTAVATPTATAAPPTPTPPATFTPVPQKPECPVACKEAFELIWNFGRPVAEAISQQPWFKDGVNGDDAVFINSLRIKFGVPEIYDIIAAPQDHFVHGSIDTLLGKKNVAVLYVPEQYIEGHGLVLTDARTAENVLSLYMAYTPLPEQYLKAPYLGDFNPPDSPSNMYTIFINIKNRANAQGSINTLSNRKVQTHIRETNLRYHFGPIWMAEGSADFIALKLYEGLVDKTGEWNGLTPPPSLNELYDRLKSKVYNERYIKGQGYVPTPAEGNLANSVPVGNIPLEEMFDYKVSEVTQGHVTFVLLVDLERIIGEEALRNGYRTLISMNSANANAADVYNSFRQYAPPDKLQPFDELFETRVFGPERFREVKQQAVGTQ